MMKPPVDPITRISSVLMTVISAIVAVCIPAGYFIVSYRYMTGSINTELAFSSRMVEGLVINNPKSWRFEELRLRELLERRLSQDYSERRTIRDIRGDIVTETEELLAWPVLTFEHPVYDYGVQVATIELRRSIRPLVVQTALVGAGSILAAVAIFLMFRFFPLRAVRDAYRNVKENEQRFMLALKSGNFGVSDWYIKRDVMIWDDRMYEIYGVKKETFTVTKEAWQACLHPQDRTGVLRKISVKRSGVRGFSREFRIVHPDGQVRYVKADGMVLTDSGGMPFRVIFLNQDITERKQAELIMQDAHSELENVVKERTQALTIANARQKALLEKQAMDILLAKKIMSLIDARPYRHSYLAGGVDLFASVSYVPCYAEGGDHYFVKNFTQWYPGRPKTVLSLKDQSGHEVGCILRSIVTDLLHNALLVGKADMPVEECITRLNRLIFGGRVFQDEDFFTAVNAEIDHGRLTMRFVSAGHPPFLLVRGDEIACLPALDGPGRNLPVGIYDSVDFTAGEVQLRKGDKLVFYTDGLTDIPRRWGRSSMDAGDLRDIVLAVVREDPQMPISVLMAALFDRLCGQGDCRVSDKGLEDDVTLVGLELEDRDRYDEDVIRPQDLDDFSRCVADLQRQIAEEWKANGFASPESRLFLVLGEALVNAWTHGNRREPGKAITVRRRYGNDAVLEVIDEGEGFDFKSFYDPTAGENVLRSTGRGNYIMRLMAEDVQWLDGGRHLVACFSREAVGHAEKPGPVFNLWRPIP